MAQLLTSPAKINMSDTSKICSQNNQEDFQVVSYKKRSKRPKTPHNNKLHVNGNSDSQVDVEATLTKLEIAIKEISSSDLFSSTLASLKEALDLLNNPELSEIICLGLGKVGESMIARYQLALLLCLRDKYNVRISVYDPQFCDSDRKTLEKLECTVLGENCEGKYRVSEQTVFYLPHCPKQLTNNLLWANWGTQLSKCVIIANSFNKIVENNSKRVLRDCCEFIVNILQYVEEFAIFNTFKYYEIFNDLAIHVFPRETLGILTSEFWNFCIEEPKYLQDVEFITNSLSRI